MDDSGNHLALPTDKLGRNETKELQERLEPGEEVVGVGVGQNGQAVVLTGSRVLIVKAGFQAKGVAGASFEYGQITSVHAPVKMGSGVFQINTAMDPVGYFGAASSPNAIPFGKGGGGQAKFETVAEFIRSKAIGAQGGQTGGDGTGATAASVSLRAPELSRHDRKALERTNQATEAALEALRMCSKKVTLDSGAVVTMVASKELAQAIEFIGKKDVEAQLTGRSTAAILTELTAELQQRKAIEEATGFDGLHLRALLESEGLDPCDSPMILHRGETAYVPLPAKLARYRSVTRFQGRSQGISVPLGHGFRYRVGTFRGHPVSEQQLRILDTGTLLLTTERIAFVGSKQTVSIPISKVAHIEAAQNGIEIAKEGKEAMDFFICAAGPFFLGCFNYLIERGTLGPLHPSLPTPATATAGELHPSPAQPGGSVETAQDIPKMIRELAELRDTGVLTEDEFQTKKADLLSRL